jgi:hypothetical protein
VNLHGGQGCAEKRGGGKIMKNKKGLGLGSLASLLKEQNEQPVEPVTEQPVKPVTPLAISALKQNQSYWLVVYQSETTRHSPGYVSRWKKPTEAPVEVVVVRNNYGRVQFVPAIHSKTCWVAFATQQEALAWQGQEEVVKDDLPLIGEPVWVVRYEKASRYLGASEVPSGTNHDMGNYCLLLSVAQELPISRIKSGYGTEIRFKGSQSHLIERIFWTEQEARKFADTLGRIYETYKVVTEHRDDTHGISRFNR